MDFRVLGPMEVAGPEGAVALGGPKQRAVLAQLLIHPNQVVSIDALIDGLWDEEPPESARGTIQAYVHNLRRALGPGRIESHAPGYVLRADADEIDARRFEAQLHDSRRLGEEPWRAAEVLREGLALWRGPAFADLDGLAALRGEIARLDELRLRAIEDRIGFELAAGRHAEVLGELESLVHEHPLRERLWEHLMLACYRAGRQSDALAAFDTARRLLADELGIDPTPELRRLQGQILRQDPSLELRGQPLRGYRVLERIGDGAFGVVYRALQPQVDREVAIKSLHPELAGDPSFIRRFDRDAQIVARLEHRHVVPLYDYWRDADGAYLVMRFMRGGSLRERIKKSGGLSAKEASAILDQIAEALSGAHRHGIIHGDVKPENVLLDEEGNAYLTDFSIATEASDRHASRSAAIGTIAYLSPEQINGEPITPQTDVYSLGIVLYESLTGRHPLPDGSVDDLLWRQLHDRLPSVLVERPELPPVIDAAIATATSKDPTDRYADVVALVAAFHEALGLGAAEVPMSPVAAVDHNPYKGLRPFDEADAPDFFGREALVERLLARLSETVDGSRLLGVVGPSGSGKSSVVRAGLVPALRGGALPGSDAWFYIEMTPGAHPFEELEAALRRIAVDPPSSLLEQLENDEDGFLRVAERVLPSDGSELLLVVDQFEELFTRVENEQDRARFMASLVAAAMGPRSRVRMVVTLRGDFYDRPLAYEAFGALLGARTQTVGPLSPRELERAVVGPAERVGVMPEPALLAEVVADAVDRPGALPLLQFALAEIFERRRDHSRLTLADYQAVGGLGGALAGRAEHLYEAGDEAHRETIRQIFLHIVDVGDAVEGLPRRVRRSELGAMEVDPASIAVAIDEFESHRLLTFDRDPVTREPTVEVAHEALLRSWERLTRWIEAARDDLRTEQRLAAEAAEWEEGGRDPSYLLRGPRLEQFDTWADRTDVALASSEREYLTASLDQRERERRAEEAQREREASLKRLSVIRLRALVAVLTVGALVAASLALVAMDRGRRAEREARIATARELAAAANASLDVDPDRSILLAIQAIETTRSVDGSVLPEAEEALHTVVTASRLVRALPGGDTLDWSPRGVFAAVDAKDASDVIIGDEETGQIQLTISASPGEITDVAFSPDGSLLATTSDRGRLIVWDASTGEVIAEASGAGAASGPSFSADGSVLAAAWSGQGLVKLLDVSTGSVIRVIRNVPGASSTALETHGRTIAIGTRPPACDGRPWPWAAFEFDLRTGHRIPLAGSDPCGPSFLAWSPDGRYIAGNLEGPGRGVQIWNAAMAGKPRFHLVGHTDSILSGDWSSDSSRLVTGSYDSTARVWSITPKGWRELYTLSTQDNRVVSNVAFSPDDAQVMTAHPVHPAAPRPFELGTMGVTIWDVSEFGGAEVANLPSGCGGLARSDAAFVGDGRQIILADERCGPAVWDLDGEEVRTIGPSPAPGRAWWEAPLFESSADGATIATAPGDGTVSLWDAATGNRVFSVRGPQMDWFELSASGDFVLIESGESVSILDRSGSEVGRLSAPDGLDGAALSSDGGLVALATGQRVTIWNWERGAIVATVLAQTEFLAFDSGGTLLATAGDDRTPEIWTVETGELVRRLPPQPGDIYGLAFSPDGSRLAVGSADGTIRLADTRSQQEVMLPGGGEGVQDIAFSADGSMLATTSAGVARIWALDMDDLLRIAQGKLTRSWTEDECRTYLHLDACPA